MLTDIASVGFRVENFTRENMATLEEKWQNIRHALLETVELVDSFGFDSRTLQAHQLPPAHRILPLPEGSTRDFEVSDRYIGDRRVIRGWLTRSILKESGIWGSGLDTLLTALREIIRNNGENEFPAENLRRVMAQRGKTIDFGNEEIEDLADIRAGDRRIFPLLTLLFPDIGSRDGSDVDHVFPKSRFTPGRLKSAGIEDDWIEEFIGKSERIANLQLLDRTVNNEKRATLPAEWLDIHCPTEQTRLNYCERHQLGDVPREIIGFRDFYEARRES